jgi:hypothetical protein
MKRDNNQPAGARPARTDGAPDVEVLVVGGGPAGVSAAFAAARMGAKTLIAEQFNCLGGISTAGGHGHTCLYTAWGETRRIVGGITFEIAERVARAGFGVYHANGNCDFEIEGMKLVLEQMAEECSCRLLYHTFGADALVEDGCISGMVVQNKSGRQAIRAKRVIDCTGDGDTAASAGCAFRKGDDETGHCQPMTLMFTVGGVDWPRVQAWRTDYKMLHVWEKAQKDGIMHPFQNQIMGFWWTPTRPDQVGINFTHVNFVDATSAADLTAATVEGRKQAYESIEVFRKVVPGMENCYMVSTPNVVGTRESRRITGEYVLTRDDIVSSRTFADSIGYGSFFIDIHGTTGPGMDRKTWRPPKGFHYQIPYRILVPVGVDNLLVAGRCASCDHEALGSLRVMPQCGVMGQAAGVAAALSIRAGVTPRNLDPAALRSELRRQGCIIDEDDITRANAVS